MCRLLLWYSVLLALSSVQIEPSSQQLLEYEAYANPDQEESRPANDAYNSDRIVTTSLGSNVRQAWQPSQSVASPAAQYRFVPSHRVVPVKGSPLKSPGQLVRNKPGKTNVELQEQAQIPLPVTQTPEEPFLTDVPVDTPVYVSPQAKPKFLEDVHQKVHQSSLQGSNYHSQSHLASDKTNVQQALQKKHREDVQQQQQQEQKNVNVGSVNDQQSVNVQEQDQVVELQQHKGQEIQADLGQSHALTQQQNVVKNTNSMRKQSSSSSHSSSLSSSFESSSSTAENAASGVGVDNDSLLQQQLNQSADLQRHQTKVNLNQQEIQQQQQQYVQEEQQQEQQQQQEKAQEYQVQPVHQQQQPVMMQQHQIRESAKFVSKSLLSTGNPAEATENTVRREHSRNYKIKSHTPSLMSDIMKVRGSIDHDVLHNRLHSHMVNLHHSKQRDMYTPTEYRPTFASNPRCICMP